MKTVIRFYGGKQRLLKYILPLVPPNHTVYTESFVGGAAMFFAKEPVGCNVLNDTNKELVNFYSACVKHFDELELEIQSTLHSHTAFNDAKLVYNNPHLFSEVKRAWAVFVLSHQSFGGCFENWGFCKDHTITLSITNKKARFTDEIKERLEKATIENDDALKVINRYDTELAFHYVDPPYFNSDCSQYGGYTEQDFRNLLELLSKVKGKFLLSSYPSEVLNEYVNKNGWFSKEIKQQICVNNRKGTAKRNKVEVLTTNYPI